MSSIPTSTVVDDDAIDLRAAYAELRSRGWWILASVVLFTGLFAAYAFLTKPVYRSSTILLPVTDDHTSGGLGSMLGEIGGLASIAGISLDNKRTETEAALAVLRSREFTERFIMERELMPKFFPSKWDAQARQWKTPPDEQPTPVKGYRYFDRKVRSIVTDKKTGLTTLHVDWTDREEAAVWANELVQRLNHEMRGRAISKADASLGYLEAEFKATTTVPTRDAIGRLIEAQVKQRMLANVTPEYAFRIIDRALPADIDDPVRPKKLKLLAIGLFLGVIVGVGGVLIAGHLRFRTAGAS